MNSLHSEYHAKAQDILNDLRHSVESGKVSQAQMSSLESLFPQALDKNYPVETFSKTPSTQNVTIAKQALSKSQFSLEMLSGAMSLSVIFGYVTVLNQQSIKARLQHIHSCIDDVLAMECPSEGTINIESVVNCEVKL